MAGERARSTRAVGHLDLLGAQSLAITDPDGFRSSLADLEAAVDSSASLLGDHGSIYLFADCLYFEAASLTSALDFAAHVRSLLLAGKAFFKCAIAPGDLGARTLQLGAGKKPNQVHGTVFGPGVIDVFQLHNRLTGVGVSVSNEFPSDSLHRERRRLASSMCFSGMRQYDAFTDLLLTREEVQNHTQVRELFEHLRRLRFRSRDLPAKYFPLILNFVRSSDFKRLNLAAAEVGKRNIPPVMEFLTAGGMGRDSLGTLPWFPMLQMALVDQWTRTATNPSQSSTKAFLERIMGTVSRPPIDLDKVPANLLGAEARKVMMDVH